MPAFNLAGIIYSYFYLNKLMLNLNSQKLNYIYKLIQLFVKRIDQ